VIGIINKLPKNHFGHISDQTIGSLIKGVSATVTGIPGFGKTYFPRFIEKRINEDFTEIKTAIINLDLLNPYDFNSAMSQIKNRIGCQNSKDIQTYLENISRKNQVILILEGVSSKTDKRLLRLFYNFGNINPTRIVFLTIANYTILDPDFIKESNGYALFAKTLIIPPFDLEGTKRIIDINNNQYGWRISENIVPEIYKFSGGNPALILYISLYLTEYDTDSCEFIDHMLQFPALLARVNDIANVIIREPLSLCYKLGIIGSNGEIFSQLVSHYLGKFEAKGYGFFMKNLSERERRLLSILIENKGKVVEKEKISQIMLQTPDTYSLWAIYKTIQRLKNKIKEFYTIQTIKDKGYVLKEIA